MFDYATPMQAILKNFLSAETGHPVSIVPSRSSSQTSMPACDLLCRVTFASHVFDDVFANVVGTNDEGSLSAVPFTAETVERYPMQAAGAALLRLAGRLTKAS